MRPPVQLVPLLASQGPLISLRHVPSRQTEYVPCVLHVPLEHGELRLARLSQTQHVLLA
jgi:hypothetical protein